MIIYVDPACDILYSSFYIQGFINNQCKVRYNSKYFKIFRLNNKFLPLVIVDNDKQKKIIIDFGDSSDVEMKAYRWSDFYFKINSKKIDLEKLDKLKSIGPSFGVKIYKNHFFVLLMALLNYSKAFNRIDNKKRFFSNYKAMSNRLCLREYLNDKFVKKYVFFQSSLWEKELRTNNFRNNFIEACKLNSNINFEGGFAPRSNGNNFGFDKNVTNNRISIKKYINNLKKSFIVFNTPAVLDCHGWKLGEYFALGKIIISTPLLNELPSPLIENEHYLLTNGEVEDICNKINFLLNNDSVLDKIQKNVNQFYNLYLSPDSVCLRIINYI